jgi:hypothetical protein
MKNRAIYPDRNTGIALFNLDQCCPACKRALRRQDRGDPPGIADVVAQLAERCLNGMGNTTDDRQVLIFSITRKWSLSHLMYISMNVKSIDSGGLRSTKRPLPKSFRCCQQVSQNASFRSLALASGDLRRYRLAQCCLYGRSGISPTTGKGKRIRNLKPLQKPSNLADRAVSQKRSAGGMPPPSALPRISTNEPGSATSARMA